jgi:uncharacterized damage-inducible protein DinB
MLVGMPFPSDIQLLLVRELDGLSREVAMFPDDDRLWATPPGVTNAAGNLALHVAGNVQHFVGAQLGRTGYVRNREAEFSTRSGTREDVQRQLRQTRDVVAATLAQLDSSTLAQSMPGAPNGMVTRTDLFLLHLVAHAAFHLGQAGYVRRIVCGDTTSANPLPLDVLSERREA